MTVFKKKTIVSFLASGRGSNFRVVAENILNGGIDAELGILITDKAGIKACDLAEDFGMKYYVIDPKKFSSREDHELEMISVLEKHKTGLIVAAGYMRLLTPVFVKRFRHRIINIHPALLPAFPGTRSQRQAFEYGVKVAGCTAHFIDEGTDTGPIIAQSAIIVFDTDDENSLSARILKEEHKILSHAVNLFCENKLTVNGRIVSIKE